MIPKIFINTNSDFLPVINLLKSKKIDFDILDYIDKYIINAYSYYFISFNKISEKELTLLQKSKLCDNIYILISEKQPNDIINLLKLGFKNIFFDINNFINKIENIKPIALSNNILSDIIDKAEESIVITDINGDIIYVNKKIEKLTGYSYEESIGKNPRILKTDFHDNKFYKDLWETISSGEIYECEFKNKRKNGTYYWEFARISPVFDNNGVIQYYFAVKKDITQEKEITKNFQLHKELISSIHNFTSDFFCIQDANNKWVFANKNLCNIFGISETDYFNKTDIKLSKIIKKNKAAFEKCLFYNKIVSTKQDKEIFNARASFDDKEIVINFLKTPIFNIDGTKKAIITTGRDISDIIKLQNLLESEKEKAEKANKLKSFFISNISHDLRSPLNAIYGFTNILLDDKSINPNAQKYLNLIKDSSSTILNMLNDILDISRLENNKITIKKTNVLVYLVLLEIFEQNIIYAQKKHLELILDYKIDKNFQILSDELRLKQIINNLVTNAIKYTNKGYVKISCNTQNNNLIISVKDSGIGIPKDKQNCIFNRFYQIAESTKKQLKGYGLGLSISKLLSEKLGGALYFESKENIGSEFYFKLPLSFFKENKKHNNKIEKQNINIKNKNFLIVEDDKNSILLYKEILKEANLFFADTGLKAIEKTKEINNLDIILMDIHLPELSGLDAIKEIRKFNTNVTIIIQTAFAMSGDKEKFLSVGGNDYIVKPIVKDNLFKIIKKYLN